MGESLNPLWNLIRKTIRDSRKEYNPHNLSSEICHQMVGISFITPPHFPCWKSLSVSLSLPLMFCLPSFELSSFNRTFNLYSIWFKIFFIVLFLVIDRSFCFLFRLGFCSSERWWCVTVLCHSWGNHVNPLLSLRACDFGSDLCSVSGTLNHLCNSHTSSLDWGSVAGGGCKGWVSREQGSFLFLFFLMAALFGEWDWGVGSSTVVNREVD